MMGEKTKELHDGPSSPETGEKETPAAWGIMAALSAAVMVACKKSKVKE